MSRSDERLKVRVEESTYLTYTGLHDKTNKKYLTTKRRSTHEKSTSVMAKRTIQTRWYSDYKLRDLRDSHTLGWSWNWNT